MTQGILVAADCTVEWLFPWWWKYYRLYNTLPVTFVDFGMSPKAKEWCQARGSVIDCEMPPFVTPPKQLTPQVREKWEKEYSPEVWKARQGWFKKPFALLKTPYDETLWLDLDCEVCAPLSELFEYWNRSTDLGIVRERDFPNKIGDYNSGVMIFKKNAPFLKEWAEMCLKANHRYQGDQNILTDMILQEMLTVHELPDIFNWLVPLQGEFHLGARVVHWGGSWGKRFIKKQGGFHEMVIFKLLQERRSS